MSSDLTLIHSPQGWAYLYGNILYDPVDLHALNQVMIFRKGFVASRTECSILARGSGNFK